MHCTFLFGSKRDEYCRKHGCHWRFLTGADVSTLTRFPHSNACVSWRTTAACDPTGKRESDKDKLCNEVVPSTLSGYCECEGGHQVALSSCEHLPLQCSELCPRQTGPGCVAWRTTAGCDPHGHREHENDRPCNEIIPNTISGYCECGEGLKVAHSECGHEPLQCSQICRDSQLAMLN